MYKLFSKGERTLITKKIESGKQLGTALRVYKDQQYSWYEYAVQKKDNIYYVYESEIEEKNIDGEAYDYQHVHKYSSLEDVKEHFPNKYGICFDDIHPLKGTRIFEVTNADSYNADPWKKI